MIFYLRQMPGLTLGLGFDVRWFYFFGFQIMFKALSFDAIVSFLSDVPVCLHEIYGLKFSIADDTIGLAE